MYSRFVVYIKTELLGEMRSFIYALLSGPQPNAFVSRAVVRNAVVGIEPVQVAAYHLLLLTSHLIASNLITYSL